MGCASAKHVSTVQKEDEGQKGSKGYNNGDTFGDEYRIKPVEEVKYMKNGEEEEEQKIAAKNQENLEKSASPANVRLKANREVPGLSSQSRTNMHISDSQQEFFRMLDEKIEKGRDYRSEEEDIT